MIVSISTLSLTEWLLLGIFVANLYVVWPRVRGMLYRPWHKVKKPKYHNCDDHD